MMVEACEPRLFLSAAKPHAKVVAAPPSVLGTWLCNASYPGENDAFGLVITGQAGTNWAGYYTLISNGSVIAQGGAIGTVAKNGALKFSGVLVAARSSRNFISAVTMTGKVSASAGKANKMVGTFSEKSVFMDDASTSKTKGTFYGFPAAT